MLKVTVHVLTSGNPYFDACASQTSVYIGLVMQYHYVGLDKQPVPKGTSDTTGDVNSTDDLDDAIIEEGDEHTRHITGGPRGSMLTIENAEADPQLLSVCSTG